MDDVSEDRDPSDSASDLDVSGLFGEPDTGGDVGASQGSSAHSDAEADPPLLRVVRDLLSRMPMGAFISFVETWRQLAAMSANGVPLKSGSGCTGSGMDWLVVKTITEAFVHAVCCVFVRGGVI